MKQRSCIRRLGAWLLALAVAVSLAPAALAADGGGQKTTLDISRGDIEIGEHSVSGKTPDGQHVGDHDPDGYIITGTTTTNTIKVTGGTHFITLDGVNIDVSGDISKCAFEIKTGATVTLTLKAGTENSLKSGDNRAGLEVPKGAKLTINGSGKLAAASRSGAGIGGGGGGVVGAGGSGGEVTIEGSAVVTATSNEGAGIGGGSGDLGGNGGNGGTVTIQDNAVVTATSSSGGAGIGGGRGSQGGDGGTVTIQGNAVVTATSIGGGGGSYGGDGTGSNGADGTRELKSGVVFQGRSGEVYHEDAAGVTLPRDLEIPANNTLTIPGGKKLTVPKDVTLTNKGTLTNNGEIKGDSSGDGTLAGGGTFGGTGDYTLKVTRSIPAPTAADKSHDSVTLAAVTPKGDGTVEYAKSTGSTAPAEGWQAGLSFDGLNPGTTYYFFARVTGGAIYQDAVSDGKSATTDSRKIDVQAIPGVTPPVRGAEPVTAITPTAQYTGAVAWSPAPGAAFDADTEYTATITLTPKTGYTLEGVGANSFTVDGASSVTNEADSGVVTAKFPKTDSAPSVDPVDPVVPSGGSDDDDDEGYDTDRETVDEVKQAKDGETVELDLPPSGKVPNEVLEAAAGKDITLEISAGDGVTWIIHGKDIPKGKLADLNLKVDTKANTIPVTVINAVTGEKKVMQLALSHNGGFPFPLTLRLEVGKESAGLWANLYYYDEAAGVLDYQSSAKIGEKGAADIPFAHASSYAVVIDEASHGALPFADVREGDWCYEGVRYVYNAGLLRGTGETAFSPNGPMTRGMFVTALYRLAGQPQDAGEGGAFTDVPESAYYAGAVRWASALGIVRGVSDDLFVPDRPVTRQQMAVIMANYAKAMGHELPTVREDVVFTDQSAIAPWAAEAVAAMQRAGIMGGKENGALDPAGTATRAQAAVVLQRFTEATEA